MSDTTMGTNAKKRMLGNGLETLLEPASETYRTPSGYKVAVSWSAWTEKEEHMTKKERRELARQLAAGKSTGYGVAVAENDAQDEIEREERNAELETRTAEPEANMSDDDSANEESAAGTPVHESSSSPTTQNPESQEPRSTDSDSLESSADPILEDSDPRTTLSGHFEVTPVPEPTTNLLTFEPSAVLDNIVANMENAETVEEPLTDQEVELVGHLLDQVNDGEPCDDKPDTVETPFGDALTNPPVPVNDVLMAKMLELQKQLESLRGGQKPRKQRVASGSKPRPNVNYVILNTGVQWSGTPQVGQLINILATAPAKELDETELVKLIQAGHDKGLLRTKQEPFRIFQYYRDTLKSAGVLLYS
jgi:hypothetical protein